MKENSHLFELVTGQPPISKLLLNQIARYVNQRENTGQYEPWLHSARTSVCSVSGKYYNSESDYPHEIMSLLEKDFLRYLNFLPNVTEINSQFPLLPINETLGIASEMGVKHPSFLPKGNIKKEHNYLHACVMTTDMNIGYCDEHGEFFREAIALKIVNGENHYSSNLTRHNNIKNKLEIERRFWASRNRRHQVVTQKSPYLSRTFIKNLKRAEKFVDVSAETKFIDGVKDKFKEYAPQMGYYPLGVIEDRIANEINIKASLVHTIILHLIWHQVIHWDMQSEIAIHKRLALKKGAIKCVWR